MRDTIYQKPLGSVSEFVFDARVAGVFDNMIERSVPLYADIQLATAKLCARLATPGSAIYDLGCSSGTTLVKLAEHITDSSILIAGIDNSPAMLAEAEKKLSKLGFGERVKLTQGDIRDFVPQRASVIILNYTMQFLPIAARPLLLKRLFDSLIPGGTLLLSEKVTHRSETLNQTLYEMHHDFKRANGYSDLEIAQKRDALENVLLPLSVEENTKLLHEAGFREVELYAKWYNFASFIAFRG